MPRSKRNSHLNMFPLERSYPSRASLKYSNIDEAQEKELNIISMMMTEYLIEEMNKSLWKGQKT